MESFNGKLREELLNGDIFHTLNEAKVVIEAWRSAKVICSARKRVFFMAELLLLGDRILTKIITLCLDQDSRERAPASSPT